MSNVDTLKNHLKRQLNQDQHYIATTRTNSGFRRVKGPAGSGKTLALAARAAVLFCEGKSVFICSGNKTLGNYIRHISNSFISEADFSNITFLYFHRWCGEVCYQTGYKSHYEQYKRSYTQDELWRSDDPKVPKLVSDIYSNPSTTSMCPRYDAILIDEGHDFHISWVQTLRKAKKEDGEMLFVTDQTQDIYETAHSWTDERMEGCGFSGRWRELKDSYRLAPRMKQILRDFLDQFPFQGERNPPPKEDQQEPEEMFDTFRWVQVPSWKFVDACIEEVERLHENPDIHTVYFLTNKKSSGISVVSRLQQRGISDIIHTYDSDWQKSHDAKINFNPGCADICATTVHSFKGWEASHLVVYIESINTDRDKKLFYTALSRLKKHPQGTKLTVVSSCPAPELEAFGRKYFRDFDPPILDTPGFDFQVNTIPF